MSLLLPSSADLALQAEHLDGCQIDSPPTLGFLLSRYSDPDLGSFDINTLPEQLLKRVFGSLD